MPQGNIVPRFAGPAFLPGKEGGLEGREIVEQFRGCPRHCCRKPHCRKSKNGKKLKHRQFCKFCQFDGWSSIADA